MKKKILSVMLAVCMVLGLMPGLTQTAYAAGTVHTVAAWDDPLLGSGMPGVASGDTLVLPEVAAAGTVLSVPAGITALTVQGRAVYTNLSIVLDTGHPGLTLTIQDLSMAASSGIDLSGATASSLLLAGSNTIGSRIVAPEGMTLTIDGSGSLTANAGIGGGHDYTENGGTVIIYGGSITAQGEEGTAGIGGGNGPAQAGDVVIWDGTITATGGDDGSGGHGGAGIGCGYGTGNPGTVTIHGGTIVATGIDGGAGIGGGYGHGTGGVVTINGGDITTTGGDDGADNYGGAGIGSGSNSGTFTVAINGGTIRAYGGANAAGIGAGRGSQAVDIAITDATVIAVGGSGIGEHDGTPLSSGGAGIGGAAVSGNGSCSISNSTVTVQGGDGSAGIGSGFKSGGMALTVTGSTITATGGENGAGIGSGIWGGGVDLAVSSGRITATGGTNAQDIGASLLVLDGGDLHGASGSLTVTGWVLITADDTISPTGSNGPYTINLFTAPGVHAGVQAVTVAADDSSFSFTQNTGTDGTLGGIYLAPDMDVLISVAGYDVKTASDTGFGSSVAFNSGSAASALDIYLSATSDDTAPTVATGAVTGVTSSGASLAGNVTSDGGATVTERGFVYGASANPTTSTGTKATAATGGTGAFTASLSGLAASTPYHVRAYAINSEGTSYGDDVTFTTLAASANGWTDISDRVDTSGVVGIVVFSDIKTVTASGTTTILISASNPAKVYRSTDGCATILSAETLNANQAVYLFPDGQSAWTVGLAYGNKTTDGGASWTRTTIGGTLYDVCFANSNVGYAVGNAGAVYRTANGGATNADWTLMTVPLSRAILAVCVPDSSTPDTVYIAIANAASTVFKSTDGGVNWTTLTLPGITSSMTSLYFKDPSTAWAAGGNGEIFKYNGTTWAKQTTPVASTLNSIAFAPDGLTGWAVGDNGVILHTSDGGANWTQEASSTTENLTGIAVVSATEAYVTGYNKTLLKYTSTGPAATAPTVTTGAVTGVTSSGASLAGNVTSDGGATVTERGFVYGDSANPTTTTGTKATAGTGTGAFTATLSGLTASTPYHVRAYAINSEGTSYGDDVSFTTLAASANGWTDISDRIVDSSVVLSDVKTVTAGGTTTILISASNPTKVYRSTDGCATILSADTLNVNHAVYLFPDGQSARTVGSSYINKSTDGGASWTRTTIGGTLYDVYFANANVGYAVGNAGAVYRTTNGGATNEDWTLMTVPVNRPILSVWVPDSSAPDTVYIAAGNAGSTVFKSTDGGANWTTLTLSEITSSMSTLYFKDPSTAWAAGGNGEIFKYNGTTWTKQTSPVTVQLNSIAFAPDGLTGWAAGNDGVILHTSDGGANWTQEASGTTENLTGVAVVSATEAYVTGYNKTLLKYTSTGPAATAPTVTTGAVTGVTSSGASLAGNVTSDGGATVTERGFVYGGSANPTTATGTKATAGTGTGAFTATLSGLTASTPYHVRAYAINSEGTSYGDDVSFTTLAVTPPPGPDDDDPPTVVTNAVTGVTSSGASLSGNVTSDGGATVTERGFVYGGSANPTTATGTKVTSGTGTGSFTATLTGLAASTTYHVRAYAINNEGTSYGADVMFTTASGGTTPTTPPDDNNPDYIPRTLTDPATGISVSGNLVHRSAALTVQNMALHVEGTCAACDAIRQRMADDDFLLLVGKDISLTYGFQGSLTITIPVGSAYNGDTVTILHCANGTLQTFTATVKNGKTTFTVTSLSPFAVFTATDVLDNIPKTGDGGGFPLGLGLSALGVLGFCLLVLTRKRRRA